MELEAAARTGQLEEMDNGNAHKKLLAEFSKPLRHSGCTPIIASGDDILRYAISANMSQAVFARHLNLTTGYVSQLERGAKKPKGPALVLLNLIRRRGIDAIT